MVASHDSTLQLACCSLRQLDEHKALKNELQRSGAWLPSTELCYPAWAAMLPRLMRCCRSISFTDWTVLCCPTTLEFEFTKGTPGSPVKQSGVAPSCYPLTSNLT